MWVIYDKFSLALVSRYYSKKSCKAAFKILTDNAAPFTSDYSFAKWETWRPKWVSFYSLKKEHV